MVSREKYFSLMSEVSKFIEPIMVAMVRPISKKCSNELYNIIYTNVIRRSSSDRPKLRPFLLVVASASIKVDLDNNYILKLAAVVELLNISTYLSNLSFDKKGVCKNYNTSQKYIIASIILQSHAIEEINLLSELKPSIREKLVNVLIKYYREIFEGQYIDLHQLSYSSHISEFLPNYVQRCRYLGGSSLEGICIAGEMINYDKNGKTDSSLSLYGRFHGLALQIINDLSDFVPITKAGKSVGKESDDIFSDFKNHRATLPIYYCFQKADKKQREHLNFIQRNFADKNNQRALIEILLNTKAIHMTANLAYCSDQLALKYLSKLEDCDMKNLLLSTLNVSKVNRFYKYFANYHEFIFKPEVESNTMSLLSIHENN